MAKYEVIETFQEETNKSMHVYGVGDKYPYSGRAKKERIEALLTSNNRVGRPFIREVEEEGEE